MKKTENIKILVTGGHMTPAAAVIDEMKRRGYKRFLWVGRKRTMKGDVNLSSEYKLIKQRMGIPFINLNAGKLYRSWFNKDFFNALISFFQIPIGMIHGFLVIVTKRPDVILSFGGYVAVAVVIPAWILRIPIITHEQTIVTGRANKLISWFARKVLISWPQSVSFFPAKKVVFTGNPVRAEVTHPLNKNFIFPNDLPTIYVTGGNQGAHVINVMIERLLAQLLKKYNIVHQTGSTSITNDFKRLSRLKKTLPKKLQARYEITEYVYPEQIGDAFDKSDLIISRSGANTCMELLTVNKPAILIPIPWSAFNEQYKNALILKEIGIANIINEAELTPEKLLENIDNSINLINQGLDFNQSPLNPLQSKTSKLIKQNAGELIADELESLLD